MMFDESAGARLQARRQKKPQQQVSHDTDSGNDYFVTANNAVDSSAQRGRKRSRRGRRRSAYDSLLATALSLFVTNLDVARLKISGPVARSERAYFCLRTCTCLGQLLSTSALERRLSSSLFHRQWSHNATGDRRNSLFVGESTTDDGVCDSAMTKFFLGTPAESIIVSVRRSSSGYICGAYNATSMANGNVILW